MNNPHDPDTSLADEAKNATRKASAPLRLLMAFAGLVFAAAGGVLAFAVGRLFLDGQLLLKATGHDRLFWVLLGVVAFCLILLAVNFWQAAARRLTRNIVPGPTLYLLGASLVILAMFMGVSNAWMTAIVLAGTGFAIMSLEYRSEFI